jgi:hypothetical protein
MDVEDTPAARPKGPASNQLVDLALLQGNRFIRDFLKDKQLRLGTTKADFERNLNEALTDNRIAPADIQEWLAGVEGWGDQHVFAFHVPEGLDQPFRERPRFAARLKGAGLQHLLDAAIPLAPDEKLTLATIRHRDVGISFIWVRAAEGLIRRKPLDFVEIRDGDELVFHAYERRWARVAARLEWDFSASLAAILLASRETIDYAKQRDELLSTVDHVITSRPMWQPLNVARAIRSIDDDALAQVVRGGDVLKVRVNSLVLRGASATARLAANAPQESYQDDLAVRQLRLAAGNDLIGGSGDCFLDIRGNPNEIHIRLDGGDRGVLLWGKMTAAEVWHVVTYLRGAAHRAVPSRRRR